MKGHSYPMLHKEIRDTFASPGEFWRTVKNYLAGTSRQTAVIDGAGLADFLGTRASHVAQTALYGYLRTRAGSLYPELFSNDAFMISVNSAKWQMWLACLSDLSIFAGGLIQHQTACETHTTTILIRGTCQQVLEQTGEPAEAGDQFTANRTALFERITGTDFAAIADDDSAFTVSPAALVHWAPVIESLKELDGEIVRNSVRFRWQEVRRELRSSLDAAAVLASQNTE